MMSISCPVLTRQSVAVDRRGGVHVVAVDDERTGVVFHGRQRADGNHVALGVADLQAHILRLHAEGYVGLDGDLPGAAEEVEVVDVQSAQLGLQRVEGVTEHHAHGRTWCG